MEKINCLLFFAKFICIHSNTTIYPFNLQYIIFAHLICVIRKRNTIIALIQLYNSTPSEEISKNHLLQGLKNESHWNEERILQELFISLRTLRLWIAFKVFFLRNIKNMSSYSFMRPLHTVKIKFQHIWIDTKRY